MHPKCVVPETLRQLLCNVLCNLRIQDPPLFKENCAVSEIMLRHKSEHNTKDNTSDAFRNVKCFVHPKPFVSVPLLLLTQILSSSFSV